MTAMSRVAGILLIVMGLMTACIGIREILHPDQLTRYGAYTNALIGGLLVLAGFAHFRAPHKAFLISIPLLIALQIQMCANALFYFNDPRWLYQVILLIASVIILAVSYIGYLDQGMRASEVKPKVSATQSK